MLTYLLITVAVIVIAFLIVAARQPDVFRVERSVAISAPPEEVFAEVNDFHKWQLWSPFVEYDRNMTTTYAGPTEGEGAEYAWSGNSKAGQGRMTIIEKVWDYNFDPGTNLVDVYVKRLREKIDDGFESKLLQTVRGIGYVLKE